MIGIMFLIFVVCMALAIPVGFSIAISATAFLFFDTGIPIFSIVQKMIDGINSFSYLALPLFVLSGAIMVYGAIKTDEAGTLVFSGVPAFLVTTVLIVQRSEQEKIEHSERFRLTFQRL